MNVFTKFHGDTSCCFWWIYFLGHRIWTKLQLHQTLSSFIWPVGTALILFSLQKLSSVQHRGLLLCFFFLSLTVTLALKKQWKGKCRFCSLFSPQRVRAVTWHFVLLFPMQQWQKEDRWRKDARWWMFATVTFELSPHCQEKKNKCDASLLIKHFFPLRFSPVPWMTHCKVGKCLWVVLCVCVCVCLPCA